MSKKTQPSRHWDYQIKPDLARPNLSNGLRRDFGVVSAQLAIKLSHHAPRILARKRANKRPASEES